MRVGQEAPDFTILYTDGSKKKLSELRGKVVMLQFTASWCGVCRQEMPFIEKDIWQKHKENPDFVLLGIDRDEPVETVEKFRKSTKVTYPLTLDPGADIFGLFALKQSGITRNVLLHWPICVPAPRPTPSSPASPARTRKCSAKSWRCWIWALRTA